MPLNIPGLLVPFQLIVYPRLVIPGVTVKGGRNSSYRSFSPDCTAQKDIRQLDFHALRKAGYRGAVFDKDNCLTLPHKDTIVPELQDAWKRCRETFGEGNVLIVSNSAGTQFDAGDIQAESVSHHLGVPVLRHSSLKPSYACISAIRRYFSSLRTPVQDGELIVVGDRIFTDVVMANRMSPKLPIALLGEKSLLPPPRGPLAIWTTGVWQRQAMVTRWLENALVKSVERWSARHEDLASTDFIREDV